MEIWRRIPEAPNYEVSNMGRVRNCKNGKILKASSNGQGLEKVDLRDAGFTMTRSVEALRKRAFG